MAEDRQARIWLNEARQGNPSALSKLLTMYHPALRAHLTAHMDQALRARVEPEDILQEVYLAAHQNVRRFEDRGPSSFINWMLTIVDRKLADVHRALHRQRRDIARERPPQVGGATESCFNLIEQLYAHSRTPSRVTRREEAVGALLASMSRLTDAHRQVIQLRFLEGRSVRDVAERMGRTETAVASLIQRALVELRKLMDGLGEFTRIP